MSMKHTSVAVDPSELIGEHLEEVLSSTAFQDSAKLSQLLRYLVEATLTGSSDPIKEQVLGIEVFERPSDWDPQIESIVRVEVKRLREMLTLYYHRENPLTPVRFEVPIGSYKALCVLTALKSSRPQVPDRSYDKQAREQKDRHAALPRSSQYIVPALMAYGCSG